MRELAAMVLSDQGKLLPFTCQRTMQQVEEEAPSLLADWGKMKELGAKVVQVEIVYEPEIDKIKSTT